MKIVVVAVEKIWGKTPTILCKSQSNEGLSDLAQLYISADDTNYLCPRRCYWNKLSDVSDLPLLAFFSERKNTLCVRAYSLMKRKARDLNEIYWQ